ncbi:MAG TPA: IPT/TIG domain-containing protein, partial [Verrucomicrobiae bacterium]
QIAITGRSFLGVTNVQLGALAISNFKIQGTNGTNITFTVPTNAPTSGKITVESSGNLAVTAQNFLLLPNIISLSAPGAATGKSITITGTGLSGASKVTFGGVQATPSTVTATSITVTVPSTAVSGPITVTTPNGTDTDTNTFYIAPRVSSFSPGSGLPGQNVTLSGLNFTGATSVAFSNAVATVFTVPNNSTIQVTIPANAKNGPITVTNPGGSASSTLNFIVLVPPPKITGFTPSLGSPGTEVTISGTNFNTAKGVSFNGLAARSFAIQSDTQITAVVPNNATTGPISVTGTGGTATSASNFVVGTTADLAVQISADPSDPISNDDMVVNFTISNQGPLPASNVSGTFSGSRYTTLSQVTVPIGTYTMSPTNAVLSLGDLAAGASVLGQFKLHVNTNALFQLSLSASSQTPDSNSTNNVQVLSLQSNPIALSLYNPFGNSVHVSWPMVSSGYVLERTVRLAPPQWTAVPDQPESDGLHYFVNLTIPTNTVFFRLRKP